MTSSPAIASSGSTGRGESNIMACGAFLTVEGMRGGLSPTDACLATLRRVSEHRTTIAIAHRLSTIADADRILVLDHGKLAEAGTHAELLRRDGLYADMWARQQAESEELGEAAE